MATSTRPNSNAGFTYWVPGAGNRTTYISRLDVPHVIHVRYDSNLSPFLTVGLADPNGWVNYWYDYDYALQGTAATLYSGDRYPWVAHIYQHSWDTLQLSGNHISYVGVLRVNLDDGENPTLDPLVSSAGDPQWAAQETATISLHGHDPGLGVKYFQTAVPDIHTQSPDGLAHQNLPTTESPGCTGATGSMCPVDGHADLSYDSDNMPEGVNNIQVSATDAAGQGDSGRIHHVLVDRSGPEVRVSGGLAGNVSPTTPIRDDFNRADGGLGSAWSSPIWSGDDGGKVVGNQFGATSTWGESYWNGQTFTDSEVYATAVNKTQKIALLLRLSNIGSPNGYEARFHNDDGSVSFNRITGGSYTNLGVWAPEGSWDAGDQLGFTAVGNMLTAYVNGEAVASVVDSTYASGYIGLTMESPGTTQRLDDFGGGSLATISFPTTAVLDNFNRGDGGLGSAWSSPIWNGDDGGRIDGNQYRADSTWGESYWNARTFTDSEVYATAVNKAQRIGLLLRLSNIGSPNGYEARFDIGDGSVHFYRLTGGSYDWLGSSPATGTWEAGDQVGFTAVGNVLTAYVNGEAVASVVDSTYASGYIGLTMESPGTTQRLDDFGGGSALMNYQVRVDAADGNSSTLTSARSGVKSIEILFDDQRVDYEEQPCNNMQQEIDMGSCDLWLADTPPDPTSLYGPHELDVVVKDQAGNPPTTWHRDLDLPDRLDPTLDVSGELNERAGEWVTADTHELHVRVADAGSGAANIAVKIDGQNVAQHSGTCSGNPCALEHDFDVDLTPYSPGPHEIAITGTDGAGRETTRTWTAKVDPTPPTLDVTGSLIGAEGMPLGNDPYSVNVSAEEDQPLEGRSGLRNIEVAVDDSVVVSDEQNCAPTCPSTTASSYSYDADDWGGGEHIVLVTATDAAGNLDVRAVTVGYPGEAPAPEQPACPDEASTGAGIPEPISVSQAVDQIESTTPELLAPSEPTPANPDIDQSLSAGTMGAAHDVIGTAPRGLVAVAPGAGYEVGDSVCVRPAIVSASASSAALVNGDSAIYANVAPATDLIVRPNAIGMTNAEVIRSAAAPESFTWEVGLDDGEQLQELPDGGVAITMAADSPEMAEAVQDMANDPDGGPSRPANVESAESIPNVNTQYSEGVYQLDAAVRETGEPVAAVISSPWVRDATGRTVPATLAVDGNHITLTVVHWSAPEPLEYPLYAISSAYGLERSLGSFLGSLPISIVVGSEVSAAFWNAVSKAVKWILDKIAHIGQAGIGRCVSGAAIAQRLLPPYTPWPVRVGKAIHGCWLGYKNKWGQI